MNTCDTCRFMHRDFGSGQLVCRRFPPTVLVAWNGAVGTSLPIVTAAGWCGEWKPEATLGAPAKGRA